MAGTMSSSEEEPTEIFDLSNPDVVTKYKTAADIANSVLAAVIEKCVVDKKITEICEFGDNLIEESVSKIYNKKKDSEGKSIEKGIAFPTCLSANHCAGHFSPYPTDTTVLKEGDLLKIDLGVHIDGFIALGAHTIVVGQNPEEEISGRKGDLLCAAYYAAECAKRLIRPGKTNQDITEIIQKVCDCYEVSPLEGVLSHNLNKFLIDGENVIANKVVQDQKVDEFTFEEHQVYCLDIVLSSGEGKAREQDARTTIFKRTEENYNLKIPAARYVLAEATKRSPALPFTLRSFADKRAKLGITECLQHDLVVPYPVLFERPDELIVQLKYTLLILPSGTMQITGHALPKVTSEFKIDSAVTQVMAMSTKRNKRKKKKAAKPKA